MREISQTNLSAENFKVTVFYVLCKNRIKISTKAFTGEQLWFFFQCSTDGCLGSFLSEIWTPEHRFASQNNLITFQKMFADDVPVALKWNLCMVPSYLPSYLFYNVTIIHNINVYF